MPWHETNSSYLPDVFFTKHGAMRNEEFMELAEQVSFSLLPVYLNSSTLNISERVALWNYHLLQEKRGFRRGVEDASEYLWFRGEKKKQLSGEISLLLSSSNGRMASLPYVIFGLNGTHTLGPPDFEWDPKWEGNGKVGKGGGRAGYDRKSHDILRMARLFFLIFSR